MTLQELIAVHAAQTGYGLDAMPNMPGVYAVVNRRAQRVYIGSAVNLYTRCVGHIRGLKRGESSNGRLRRDAEIYGAEHFTCVALQTFVSLDQAGGQRGLRRCESVWILGLETDRESVGYNAIAGGVWTKAACLRDRERKLMRKANYALLEGVDLFDPIDDALVVSWVPTPRLAGSKDRWPWLSAE